MSFQFRLGLPDAWYVETSERIQSLPEDCSESIRVQVHSANVDPDEIIEILHELMDAMAIDLDWAGITTRANERVYVADEYWNVTEAKRDLTVYQNPIEDIIQREQDLAVPYMTRGELTPE